jgi:hypothetical protein
MLQWKACFMDVRLWWYSAVTMNTYVYMTSEDRLINLVPLISTTSPSSSSFFFFFFLFFFFIIIAKICLQSFCAFSVFPVEMLINVDILFFLVSLSVTTELRKAYRSFHY